ncbi:MAG: YARHG domain-containing protein [Bacteroidota bacterium]
MKLLNLLPLILLFSLSACNNNESRVPGDNSLNPSSLKGTAKTNADLLGSFVGDFGTNKITVLITKIINDTVEGRSVVGGNDRPFVGTYIKRDSIYNIAAKEPGDEKHDGTFNLALNENNKNMLTGSWSPFKETKEITTKDFSLSRKSFVYSKEVGIYPQASQRELKDEDVNNLTKWELEVMRNEIFARHGYCFKKKNLRESFEDKDWYVPNTTDVKSLLTDVERKNLALIKRYEKYVEEYGDEFGR